MCDIIANDTNRKIAEVIVNRRELMLLDNQICFALYAASNRMTRVYRPYLESLGLTYPQYLVLLVLWERDGEPVSYLCERLSLTTATVTPLLKRLESQGLVRRERSVEDERAVLVKLTSGGRELFARAHRTLEKIICAIDMPADDVASLRDRLKALLSKLEKTPDPERAMPGTRARHARGSRT